MTDKKILDFNRFKRKSKIKKEVDNPNYDLTMAKQIVESDERLKEIIDALGMSTEEAAHFMVKISEFVTDIETVAQKYIADTNNNPVFTGLMVQAFAIELSDHLAGLGTHPAINRSTFTSFQRNAISAIVQTKHIEDFTQDYGFGSFDDEGDNEDE